MHSVDCTVSILSLNSHASILALETVPMQFTHDHMSFVQLDLHSTAT